VIVTAYPLPLPVKIRPILIRRNLPPSKLTDHGRARNLRHSALRNDLVFSLSLCLRGYTHVAKDKGRHTVKVISIGEVLWDVIEREEFLGGAPFNFAAHLHRLGHAVFFVSGVGRDQRGRGVLEKMTELGLSTEYVSRVEDVPTGWVEVKLDQTASRTSRFIGPRPTIFLACQMRN